MTPKEKALAIFKKMYDQIEQNVEPSEGGYVTDTSIRVAAKKCSLIYIDDMIYNEYQILCSYNLHDPKNVYYSKAWGDIRNILESF